MMEEMGSRNPSCARKILHTCPKIRAESYFSHLPGTRLICLTQSMKHISKAYANNNQEDMGCGIHILCVSPRDAAVTNVPAHFQNAEVTCYRSTREDKLNAAVRLCTHICATMESATATSGESKTSSRNYEICRILRTASESPPRSEALGMPINPEREFSLAISPSSRFAEKSSGSAIFHAL